MARSQRVVSNRDRRQAGGGGRRAGRGPWPVRDRRPDYVPRLRRIPRASRRSCISPTPRLGSSTCRIRQGWLDDGLATINALGLRGAAAGHTEAGGTNSGCSRSATRRRSDGASATTETYSAQLEELLRDEVSGARSERGQRRRRRVRPRSTPRAAAPFRAFAPARHGARWACTGTTCRTRRMSPDGVPQGAPPAEPVDRGAGRERPRSKPFHIGNQPSRLNLILRSSRALYVLRQAWLAAIAPTECGHEPRPVGDGAARRTSVRPRSMRLAGHRVDAERDSCARRGRWVFGRRRHHPDSRAGRSQLSARPRTRRACARIAESLGMFVVDPLPAPDRTARSQAAVHSVRPDAPVGPRAMPRSRGRRSRCSSRVLNFRRWHTPRIARPNEPIRSNRQVGRKVRGRLGVLVFPEPDEEVVAAADRRDPRWRSGC